MKAADFSLGKWWSRYLPLRLSAFVVVYCGMAAAIIALGADHVIGIAVWPAAGVAVAAILLEGGRAWPVPFVGGVFSALYRAIPVEYALLAGVGTAADALLCVWLLRRWLQFDRRFYQLMDVWGLACAAILSSALCSNINLLAYAYAGKLPWTQYLGSWMNWWSGDALGELMVVPLILTWVGRPEPTDAPPSPSTRGLMYGLILGAGLVAFFHAFGLARALGEESMLLAFPPLAWAVLRFPLRDVASGLFLVAVMAVMASTVSLDLFPIDSVLHTNQVAFFLWLISLLTLSIYVVTAEKNRILAELRESHEQMNILLETLPDGIGLKDGAGRWRLANRAALDFFSLHGGGQGTRSQEMALPQSELSTVFGAATENREAASQSGGLHTHEAQVVCPDGAPVGMVMVGRDVTEEKRLRSCIAEQERKYRLMLQTMQDGFWLMDMQGRLQETNLVYARLSGYSIDELTGMCVQDLEAQESPEETARHIRKGMSEGGDIFETRHRRKDGSLWDVEVRVSYLPENHGYIVAFMRDITNRKLAEQALLESNEQLTLLIETLPDAFFLKDGAGRWLVANQTGLGLFRLRGKDWKGKTNRELATEVPELGPVLENCTLSDKEAFHNEELLIVEERIPREDGSWQDFELRKLPKFAPDGSCAGIVVIGRDITEQKAIQQALEISEARQREQVRILQTVLDALPAEVGLLEKEGGLVTVNRHWVQHCVGYCDLLSIVGPGTPYLKICKHKLGLSTISGKKIEKGILSVLHGEAPQFVCEYSLDYPRRKRWFKLTAVPITTEQGLDGAVVMNMDTTQARNAEEVIRWSEHQYRAMTENSPDMIVRVDVAGMILYANRALAAYWQSDTKRVLGRNIVEFCPTDRARVQWFSAVEEIVKEGKARVDIVFEFDSQDELKVFQAYVVPESSKGDTEVASLLVVIRDVTELRKSEFRLRESRSQLRRLAAENEAVRESEKKDIARELHDELGQLLNALRMDIGLIKMQYGERIPELMQKNVRMLDVLDRAIASMRTVVAHLRPTVLDMGLVPALEWLGDDFTKMFGIQCQLDIRGDIPELEDEQVTAIFRIVQESLTNAAKHAQASSVRIGIMLDGIILRLVMQDDGCGFNSDAINGGGQQHFGLLGMRERALALGGTLEVISVPGEGSSVILSIAVRMRGELPPITW